MTHSTSRARPNYDGGAMRRLSRRSDDASRGRCRADADNHQPARQPRLVHVAIRWRRLRARTAVPTRTGWRPFCQQSYARIVGHRRRSDPRSPTPGLPRCFANGGALVQVTDPPGVAQCNAVYTILWHACCHQLSDGMTDRWAELDPSLQAYAQAGNGISREALLGALIERGELGGCRERVLRTTRPPHLSRVSARGTVTCRGEFEQRAVSAFHRMVPSVEPAGGEPLCRADCLTPAHRDSNCRRPSCRCTGTVGEPYA